MKSVYTEFQPLKEVIVGATHAPNALAQFKEPKLRSMLTQIIEETNEDLQKLIDVLEQAGVKVKRPEIILGIENEASIGAAFESGRHQIDLEAFGFDFPHHPLMPRDTAGIFGTKMLNFYTKADVRYFENWSTYNIFMDYFREGLDWVSMPAPPFPENIRMEEYYNLHERFMLFHAANILKCGKDLFVSDLAPIYPTGKGTELGLEWTKRVLGDDFNINIVPCGGHIDGKISILKPGVVACWNPKHLGDKLSKWDVIRIPDTLGGIPMEFRKMRKEKYYTDFVRSYLKEWIGYCDESNFHVNMLSIDESTVISSGYNAEVERELNKRGIDLVPIHFRHVWFWDGAIHCLTMDTVRDGPQEDYFG